MRRQNTNINIKARSILSTKSTEAGETGSTLSLEAAHSPRRRMNKSTISAIIIAKNEEDKIGKCINSVKWADEIILVDTGSSDNTNQLATKLGAKVYKYIKGSYGDWREYGAKKARGEWLFYIDADETCPSELKTEIQSTIEAPKFSAYAIPRRNIILGQEIKHGGWYPDYVLRLINKSKLKGYQGEIHEQPIIDGEVSKLNSPFLHTAHPTISAMAEKSNRWSAVEARLLYDSGHPPMVWWRFIRPPVQEVFTRLILKLGLLDGVKGIILNLFQGWHKLIVYIKLWELQQDRPTRSKKS